MSAIKNAKRDMIDDSVTRVNGHTQQETLNTEAIVIWFNLVVETLKAVK